MSSEAQSCPKPSISVIVKEKGAKPPKGAEGCIVKLSGKGTSPKEEKGNTVEFKDLKEGDYTINVTFEEDADIYILPDDKTVTLKTSDNEKSVAFKVEAKQEFHFSF